MRLHSLLAAASVAVLASCVPQSSSGQKFSDAAYEVAMAHRFGRLDLVVDAVPAAEREAFVLAHEDWGRSIRILDVELGAMGLADESNAHARINIGWQRVDEMTLRSSTLDQHWKLNEEGSWYLASEKVISGDPRLLVEPEPTDEKAADKPAKAGDKTRKTSKVSTSSRNE